MQPPTSSSALPDLKKLNTVVERGIVYGTESIALYPKQTPPDGAPSHRWKVYVRGPRHEDISTFVKRVVFHLHTSFTHPHRAVDAPPFEITEQGWGEFDIVISIHFKDPTEKPIDVTHTLRLFPPEGVTWPENKPVISENMDLIVFNDPNEWFYNSLVAAKQEEGPPMLQPYHISAAQAEEDAHLERILIAQKKIRDEIWRLKEKYEQTALKATQIRRLIDYQEAATPVAPVIDQAT